MTDTARDERDEQFIDSFRRFIDRVVSRQRPLGDELTPLGRVLSAHLGVDARTLAAVEEQIAAHRLADVDIAFAALAADGDRLIGVSGGQQKQHEPLSSLITSAYAAFAEGPVDYSSVDIGPQTATTAVAFGLRLISVEGRPVVVLQRGPDPRVGRPFVTLEVLAADHADARLLLERLRETMTRESVLRGQVLSFGSGEFDHGDGVLSFLPRPEVEAADIVLPEGVLARVDEQVLGIREHAALLRRDGRHLKRGVLLYGPPGTGKTLTVRHLIARAEGVTTLLLTGESIRYIAAAAQLARAMQPSMVVLEDVDLVAHDRMMHHGPQPLLFAILDALDGLDGDADVAFVLTTNRVEVLEEALVERPGRVDLAVEIPLPDAAARRALFRLYARGLAFSSAAVDHAADRSAGVTGSFAKELMRRAVLVAARAGADASDAHLEQATDELLDDRSALTRRLLGGSVAGTDGADGAGTTESATDFGADAGIEIVRLRGQE